MQNPLHAPLLAWFDGHRRDLPWRRTKDPYAIWVSEVMLQQTQVATVVPYWERWMARFPDVQSLAAADEQDVLALWQGLGYYRRGRLLLDGARFVATHGMPGTAAAWRSVPGVGPYTAGAIASISVDDPAALVDGNVERVYSRLTLDRASGTALNRNAWRWAAENLDARRPGDWNQALMELGATVCRPTNPNCPQCPLEGRCLARQSYVVEELPVSAPKPKPVRLSHAVWIPEFEGRLGIRQIPEGLWWQGMWEFPRADAVEAEEVPDLRRLVGPGWRQAVGQIRHSVTHHRITVEVSLIRCETASPELRWELPTALAALPMPAPQRKALRLAMPHIG